MVLDEKTLKLLDINDTSNNSTSPDNVALNESFAFEKQKNEIELQRLQDQLKRSNNVHILSLRFSIAIFCIVCLSLAVVFGILIGQEILHHGLSDKVLITLLSTTSIHIIGLLYLLIKYIFNYCLKV